MNFGLNKMKHEAKESTIAGSTVLITGGTGTFGSAFLNRCLESGVGEVRILSRDEKKQYDMAQIYRDKKNVKFFLGDVRDKRTIDPAMYGVDFVFHAAAMKQVPSCEVFPMEAVKTNIQGSENVLVSAVQHHARKIVCLSTDKAVYPTSAMGMTKAYMEKIALQKAMQQNMTEVCITRFGNLVASRGSAVPLFIEQVENGLPITITHPDMTRFMMTVDEATELVEKAFLIGKSGELLVRRTPACTTGDLALAVKEYLELPEDYPVEYIGIRPGEKMHESLLTEEEADMAIERGEYFVVPREKIQSWKIPPEYKSFEAPRMSKEQVLNLIRSVFEGGQNEKTPICNCSSR